LPAPFGEARRRTSAAARLTRQPGATVAQKRWNQPPTYSRPRLQARPGGVYLHLTY